jgi:cold shock CspA family protein
LGGTCIVRVSVGEGNGYGYREVMQSDKGYRFVQPSGGGRDVFVHISAVERAGLSSGKGSAVNLKIK